MVQTAEVQRAGTCRTGFGRHLRLPRSRSNANQVQRLENRLSRNNDRSLTKSGSSLLRPFTIWSMNRQAANHLKLRSFAIRSNIVDGKRGPEVFEQVSEVLGFALGQHR